MKVGDLVEHSDGTIGIVLEVKESKNSIFAEPEDRIVARVLWSDSQLVGGIKQGLEDRWYGIEIQVIKCK